MCWVVDFHPLFAEEFVEFSEAVQDELYAEVELLEKFGPQLKRPHAGSVLNVAGQLCRSRHPIAPRLLDRRSALLAKLDISSLLICLLTFRPGLLQWRANEGSALLKQIEQSGESGWDVYLFDVYLDPDLHIERSPSRRVCWRPSHKCFEINTVWYAWSTTVLPGLWRFRSGRPLLPGARARSGGRRQ